MSSNQFDAVFNQELLNQLFPTDRTDQFFDALFGDASEGAYDINLAYAGHNQQENALQFDLQLNQRPGKCLACNLTHGLPEVFSRHPIINIKGLVMDIASALEGKAVCADWRLGSTNSVSSSQYTIPLHIKLQ